MSTIELIDHLTTIVYEIVMPVIVLWIGYNLRKWLNVPDTHKEFHVYQNPGES